MCGILDSNRYLLTVRLLKAFLSLNCISLVLLLLALAFGAMIAAMPALLILVFSHILFLIGLPALLFIDIRRLKRANAQVPDLDSRSSKVKWTLMLLLFVPTPIVYLLIGYLISIKESHSF